MPRRPCLDCSRLTSNASRCDTCTTVYARRVNAYRGSATNRGYGYAWQKQAIHILTQHKAVHGEVCSGYRTVAHPATDLTVDHVIPKSAGGTDRPDNLQVLCRSCNSRKRSRLD